eukprot:scaffold2.g6870.t1
MQLEELEYRTAGWEVRFWDEAAINKLVREHYAFFLPTWNKYKKRINRADAARYMVVHHAGGLYLDADVECYREGYDMLEGLDVVLQGSHPSEGTTNAMLASVPKHPFWEQVFKVMAQKVDVAHPIDATGPVVLADALAALGVVRLPPGKWEDWKADPYTGRHSWKGSEFMVYPGLRATNQVGYHRYTGTWNQGPDSKDASSWNDNEPPPAAGKEQGDTERKKGAATEGEAAAEGKAAGAAAEGKAAGAAAEGKAAGDEAAAQSGTAAGGDAAAGGKEEAAEAGGEEGVAVAEAAAAPREKGKP